MAGVWGKGLVSEYWVFQEPLHLCRNCSLLPLSSKQPQLYQEMGSNNATVLSSDITHAWSASEGRYFHTQRPQIPGVPCPSCCDHWLWWLSDDFHQRKVFNTLFSAWKTLPPLSRSIHTQWAMGAMVQEVSLLSHGGMSSTIQYMSPNQDQKVLSSNMLPATSQPWVPSVHPERRQTVNILLDSMNSHWALKDGSHWPGLGTENSSESSSMPCHVRTYTQFHFPDVFLSSSFSPFLHLPDSQWIDETPDWVTYTHQDLNPSQNPCFPQEDNSPIVSSPEIHSCLSH